MCSITGRGEICKSIFCNIPHKNKMKFPEVFHNQIKSFFIAIFIFIPGLSGCVSSKIQYNLPPSPHALTGLSYFYIQEFKGQNSLLMKNILIQELYKAPNFEYLEEYPKEEQLSKSAALSAEILVYSVRDDVEIRPETRISMIERDIVERSEHSNKHARKKVFDFVEVPYNERIIHRTLDLNIQFTVMQPKTADIIYKNTERISFQQSYVGEDSILLIPLAEDEMERLGRELARRLLEKLNPALPRKMLSLEQGSSPMLWGSIDMGHPRILSGNRYAVTKDYQKAIKIWSYVVFAPQVFSSSDLFIFNKTVFAKLKATHLPQSVLKPLIELNGQEFEAKDFDGILIKLLGIKTFQRYGPIIKAHTNASKTTENLNLASAHYNLGSVYRLQNQLNLAAFHFAQANAYNPKVKYAQAWTDVQHELGDYNPLDTLMDRTIETAEKLNPPSEALIQPQKKLDSDIELKETNSITDEPLTIEPVELPSLFNEVQVPAEKENELYLELD